MNKVELESSGLNLEIERRPGIGLSGRFIFPPFTILRSNDAEWLRRKKQWLNLGIKSELGRGDELDFRTHANKFQKTRNINRGSVYAIGNKTKWENGLLHKGKTINTKEGGRWEGGESAWQNSGTSIFDPVLCELIYTWFCVKKGNVVDPFAGGSVRGIVANYMGLHYWGCDLSEKQIEANLEQKKEILGRYNKNITWVCGDSLKEIKNGPKADLIFTCPPYGNLEIYSTDKRDLSSGAYDEFCNKYRKIIRKCVLKLKNNRFACFVVSNYRDKKTGFYYNLVGDTISYFEEFGMYLYNDAILVTAIGSLPVRTGKQFSVSRKMGKAHQNVLIFYKGDQKKIKETFDQI